MTYHCMQDLLKCIHYFASTYYSEMGQLRDSSRQYRKEKKQKRLKRLQATLPSQSEKHAGQAQSENWNQEDDSLSSEEESKGNERETGQTSKSTGCKRRRKRARAERVQTGHTAADMYKVLDGSALMAIGTTHYVRGVHAAHHTKACCYSTM